MAVFFNRKPSVLRGNSPFFLAFSMKFQETMADLSDRHHCLRLVPLPWGQGEGLENDEFGMKNDEFGMNNDEFGMKNDELCMQNDEFCIQK